MKKYFVLLLILIVLLNLIFIDNSNNKEKRTYVEKRAIFISYIELGRYLKNNSINTSKKNIDTIIENIKKMGFNIIILQVRSFSDAIYESNIFPWSSTVSNVEGENPGFDILKYFIKKSHKENIELHAWINPYRVRTTDDVSSITDINPAFKYIDSDMLYVGGGIYYNPAKEETINLITDGVLEIVKGYDVDGILFDDYFYPNKEIDLEDYKNYIKEHDYISIDQFRLNNVNKMVKKVHSVCHKYNKKFGISPDGNIENNYNKNYADVKLWGKSNSYVDYLMPQIYYGFYNEARPFKEVIDEWDKLIINKDIDLMIALAFYKVGTTDKYAKSGDSEWINNNDIIMREIILSRNLKHYNGFALFRYDYLFNKNLQTDTTMKEIENMKQILN